MTQASPAQRMPAFFKGVAMAIEQATLQAFKLAKELSDKLKVVRPQIEKRLDELINKLAKAADDLDEQNIKLYLKALDGEKHLLTKAMASVTVATANIEQVEDDEDFLNTRLKELEAVSKAVKEAKNSFDQRYATAMAIEKMARDAAKKAGSENTKLTERLASVDKLIADVEKLAVPASKKAQLIERWAGEAVEAHDAKGLEKQQSDMDALDVPGIISDFNNAKENNDWAVRSVKEATLEAGQRREMIDDLKDFADRLKALASITDDLDDRQRRADPEHPGEQRLRHRPGTRDGRQVQRRLLAGSQPSRLGGGAQRAHHQPRGDQDQHHTGDPEEARQVQGDAAAVDQVAEPDGHRQAEYHPDGRLHR